MTGEHRRLPIAVATLALIAGNTLIFFLPYLLGAFPWSALSGDDPVLRARFSEYGAILPVAEIASEPWRLLAGTQLHGSLLHFCGNMVGLLAIGRLLEAIAGPWRLVAIYMTCGVAGALASSMVNEGTSLGASGAVLGLAGCLLAVLVRVRLRAPERVPFRIIAPLALLIFFLIGGGIVLGETGAIHVDHVAHLAGTACGFVVGAIPWFPSPSPLPLLLRALVLAAAGVAFGTPAALILAGGESVRANVASAPPERITLDDLGLVLPLPRGWREVSEAKWMNEKGDLLDLHIERRSISLVEYERSITGRDGELLLRTDMSREGPGGVILVTEHLSRFEAWRLIEMRDGLVAFRHNGRGGAAEMEQAVDLLRRVDLKR